MLTYQKKVSFLKVREYWFTYKFRWQDLVSFNTYLHVKNRTGQKIWGIPNTTHTVELRLDKDIETIVSNFSNTVKRDLKKAEKDGLVCNFNYEPDVFVAFFNEFAAIKNIFPTSKRRLEEVAGNLQMGFALLDGEIIAAHTYLVDKELGIARLWHSASKRFDEKYDSYLVGRANKMLTYQEIIFFKEKGHKIFDFGGYNTDSQNLQGINSFKLSFGGEVVPCYNYVSVGHFLFKKIAGKLGVLGQG